MTKSNRKANDMITTAILLAVLCSLLTGCPPRKPTPVVQGLNGPPVILQVKLDRGEKMRNGGQRDCHTPRSFTAMV